MAAIEERVKGMGSDEAQAARIKDTADKAKGGAYGLYAAFFSARPTVFKEPVAARPPRPNLTQNTL